jgi:hypothetical protein
MMKISIPNLFVDPRHQKTALDVQEAFQFHIEMLERKYAQSGMSVAQAKSAALKRFGDVDRIKRQCVDISRRNSLLLRILKSSAILIALVGLAIQIFASDYKVDRIGHILIMIAVLGRVLLYVRGLSPSTFLPATKETLSVLPEDRS